MYYLKNVVCYRKDKPVGTHFLPSPCGTFRPSFFWYDIDLKKKEFKIFLSVTKKKKTKTKKKKKKKTKTKKQKKSKKFMSWYDNDLGH